MDLHDFGPTSNANRTGIRATGGSRGGDGANFDILTYAGSVGKRARRRAAKCRTFCPEQARIFNDPAKLQCDEYPFGESTSAGTVTPILT